MLTLVWVEQSDLIISISIVCVKHSDSLISISLHNIDSLIMFKLWTSQTLDFDQFDEQHWVSFSMYSHYNIMEINILTFAALNAASGFSHICTTIQWPHTTLYPYIFWHILPIQNPI